jgi:hypothetical protein
MPVSGSPPSLLDARVLLVLDVEIGLMRLHQVLWRYAFHVAVHVHVLRHGPSFEWASYGFATGSLLAIEV